jgi:D-inositol-3-phosphate glycosyltransferase
MGIRRIAVLCAHTSPLASLGGSKTGGMNVYVREFAKEMGRRGVQIDVFTRRGDSDAPDVDHSLGDNVRVVYVSAGPPLPLDPMSVYPHLSQFTAGVIAFATRHALNYDLIYSHYWLSGWVAQKLKEVWHVPFVHMFHTLGHMKHRIGAGKMLLPDVRIATETQIVNWASRIIAATPAEHNQLLWLYRADRRKIAIIPPGVDVEHFQPVSAIEARRRLGLDEKCDVLLFVGRIEPLKAVDTILEAVDLINREQHDWLECVNVAVIGGDPNNPNDHELLRLQHLAKELNLEDVVKFLGAKDHKLLPLYYAAATTVIMPSDYESFGMVALESMASGTPVIATEVGGLAFLVHDQQTGFLVPSRDPAALAGGIIALLSDPEKRELLGRNAIALAQQYTWTIIVDRLVELFEDVVFRPAINRHRR